MNGKGIPLSIFDFFAYLIPGATVLIIGFALITDNLDLSESWQNLEELGELRYGIYAAGIIACYVIGHAIAAIGRLALETIFVDKIAGRPSRNFFNDSARGYLLRRYRKPYSPRFKSELDMAFTGLFGNGYDAEDRFMLCHSVVKEECPVAFSRLSTFIIQYDFARNIATAFMICAPLFAVKAILIADSRCLMLAGIFFFLFVVMVARYLKFYKRYCDEVFRSYFTFMILKHPPARKESSEEPFAFSRKDDRK